MQLYKKSIITVCTAFDGTIALRARGKNLDYKEITGTPSMSKGQPERERKNTHYIPPSNHPWRTEIWDTSKESKRGRF